jgi:hypothetical protein
MAINVTRIFAPISYDDADIVLLNPSVTQSVFNPSENYIEYTIEAIDGSFSTTDYNYNRYSFPNIGITSNNISDIIINPENDITSNGYVGGEYNVYYNFLKNELGSFNDQTFFIKEISTDRTEVTLGYTSDEAITLASVETFRDQLNSNFEYFQDFYLNFGNRNLSVANNIAINNETLDVLVNLYEALPLNIQVKNTLWIVTQVADELAFNIEFTPDVIVPTITTFPLNGPNFNLPVKDQTNNSTGFVNYESLITSSLLSTSYSQLNNLVSSSGIQIGVDYTDFSNFIHFSSAVTRINNFYYKKQLIDQYQQEINILNNITSLVTSSNISVLTNKINSIIENFDGYEYYLYYGSGSWSYPKSDSTVPYTLYPAGTPEVISWLGDAEELTGILGSASLYDRSNLDYLYNTVPNFIQEDPSNDPYKVFVEMVAQSYDNIWIYYKDVTNRYNADNRLDFGISKDLVANALKSFGVKLYQNNFSTNDLYSAFLGYGTINPETTNSLPVIAYSGQEYIDNYITASYDASVMPLDDINKEIYKRLYHNLPYLAKTKGTIPGLRALINCFGIPDTILRISEFGGRDKDTSTYDYFDQKYNYALYVTGSATGTYVQTNFQLSSSWQSIKPESIQFRFKPDIDIDTNTSQSLVRFVKATVPIYSQSLLTLEYTGSGFTSSSYSGSTYSSSYAYANLIFYPNPNDLTLSASIYQPFFNGDWWSIQLDRTSGSNDIFTLYAGSKGYYDGYDGNQILYLDSSSISVPTLNTPWSESATGGNITYSIPISLNIGSKTFTGYNGYLQEIRYWVKTGSIESFKDFIMNPHSIDYNGEENEYADYLAFRAPLGSELDTLITGVRNMTSVHPKVTGSWDITGSFVSDSDYSIFATIITSSNIESFFYDQPIAGIKNRVTDKIQIVSSSYPTGSVLSQYRSLEQTYPTLGSETPDINLLEVAFSPQNEINDDIISSLGYFNIGEYIGDPRNVSSRDVTYPDLVNLGNDFFQKYFASYNLFDYIRLIKYFDNSLFKMLQDFVPARTSLASGVVIKQHLLERNKYPQPLVEWEDVTYSGSITTAFIDGGTGGTFDSYNFTGSVIPPTFINNTQSWLEPNKTPYGLAYISHSTQDEFYNGELPGTELVVEDGELNEANTYKHPSTRLIYYDPTLYISNVTNEATFTNFNTSPNPGEIYLWWDSGSLTNPGNTRYVKPTPIEVRSYGGRTAANFIVNRTNGVKYIKIHSVDSGGLDQSNYLRNIQNLTLKYPDRSDVIYPVVGIQELSSYFLYSIGPYAPGSMTNFNTSSAGDVRNYNFSGSRAGSITVPANDVGILGNGSNTLTSPTYDSNYISFDNGGTGYLEWINKTPNPLLTVTMTSSISPSAGSIVTLVCSKISALGGPVQSFNITSSLIASPTTISGSITIPNTSIGDQFQFFINNTTFLGATLTCTNTSLTITQSPTEFNGSSSLTIIDPYVENFDYNEYNALLNNVDIPRPSTYFMDVDYSQNPVIPVNQSIILSGSANKAPVPDSNYTSKSWSNIRYNGTKYTSIKPSF